MSKYFNFILYRRCIRLWSPKEKSSNHSWVLTMCQAYMPAYLILWRVFLFNQIKKLGSKAQGHANGKWQNHWSKSCLSKDVKLPPQHMAINTRGNNSSIQNLPLIFSLSPNIADRMWPTPGWNVEIQEIKCPQQDSSLILSFYSSISGNWRKHGPCIRWFFP